MAESAGGDVRGRTLGMAESAGGGVRGRTLRMAESAGGGVRMTPMPEPRRPTPNADVALDMPDVRDNILQHLDRAQMPKTGLVNKAWHASVREGQMKAASAFENDIASLYRQQDVAGIVRGLLLHLSRDTARLQETGITALYNLTTEPSSDSGLEEPFEEHELAQNMIVLLDSGGMRAVARAMQVHRACPGLVVACCGVLLSALELFYRHAEALDGDAGAQQRAAWHQTFDDARGIVHMLGVMEAHPTNVPLLKQCLKILGLYADISSPFDTPRGTMGVKQVVDVLQALPDEYDLHFHGARAIHLLMLREFRGWRNGTRNYVVRQHMIDYDGMGALLQTVRRWQSDSTLPLYVLFRHILCRVYYSDRTMEMPGLLQGIPFLDGRASLRAMEGMSRHDPAFAQFFMHTCLLLFESTQWARDMVVAEGVAECMRLADADAVGNVHACVILNQLVCQHPLAEDVANQGVVSTLIRLLSSSVAVSGRGLEGMLEGSEMMYMIARSEVSAGAHRSPAWILRAGGLNALCSTIDMDIWERRGNTPYASPAEAQEVVAVIDYCVAAVRQLHLLPHYRGPIQEFRHRRRRPKFTALLDSIEAGGDVVHILYQ